MNIPTHLKYTKEHEWVKIDGEFAWIGITDFAQGELGDIVFVELPDVGKNIKQNQTFGTIEAVKAVSDLYAPISGKVVEVNKIVQDTPEIINKEPYETGWMIKVEIADAGELGALLDPSAYKALIGQ